MHAPTGNPVQDDGVIHTEEDEVQQLKTRGSNEPVLIEIKYREHGYPLITYHLAIDERRNAPVVVEE